MQRIVYKTLICSMPMGDYCEQARQTKALPALLTRLNHLERVPAHSAGTGHMQEPQDTNIDMCKQVGTAHRVCRASPQVESEEHKVSIVVEANAVIHPGAVVVHPQHTPASRSYPAERGVYVYTLPSQASYRSCMQSCVCCTFITTNVRSYCTVLT